MGTTRTKKVEAQKPWRLSVIIKLVGQKNGYQFLLKKLQTMWSIQNRFALIDLSNDFFIVRLTHGQNYEIALFGGPWMIEDNYLHVQRWVPNFVAEEAGINKFLLWLGFLVLPVQYYIKTWLERAGGGL